MGGILFITEVLKAVLQYSIIGALLVALVATVANPDSDVVDIFLKVGLCVCFVTIFALIFGLVG